ncbi:anthranilate synthase component II [Staphylococcus argensis]|uniref:Glutamine amidotransferase n=1 Tax=Staphylococcus argensis TaxID=1607738 RepID=A0A2K4FEY7_9STAP|nr:aminodeoxychorismate/anthranilate synthase component II [Staphylococcus argensis]MCY6990411.1 aminodeoxychorismate/anthranilate synthase component II [Staphylococcus argensis]POA09924.1 glutamine amidotransferase [Staphylococcus argensis]
MILIIDNYDSFTYNLVDIVEQHRKVKLTYVDQISFNQLVVLNIEGIIISPGPGHPMDYPELMKLILLFPHVPILGVCLGAQALTCYYGGEVIQGSDILHGRVDQMEILEESKLLRNITQYSDIMRYHSLVSNPKSFPKELTITAQTSDCIQAFEHQSYPHYGVQFHPESFATEYGEQVILNFLDICKEATHRGVKVKTSTATSTDSE